MPITRYRMLGALFSVICALIVLGAVVAIAREWVATWIVVCAALILAIAFSVILPSRRRVALASLAAGICPCCGGGRVRHYPDQQEAWFCRDCFAAFTSRGRRVRHDEETQE